MSSMLGLCLVFVCVPPESTHPSPPGPHGRAAVPAEAEAALAGGTQAIGKNGRKTTIGTANGLNGE